MASGIILSASTQDGDQREDENAWLSPFLSRPLVPSSCSRHFHRHSFHLRCFMIGCRSSRLLVVAILSDTRFILKLVFSLQIVPSSAARMRFLCWNRFCEFFMAHLSEWG
ncbi:hypothetical protein BaRGS_00003295 [Batillaria attramentaria]|uniref:Uncharacterized protein n=1 Tax=Batillaria attramentaria TaxID=370345 RepID=A0ABD0M0V8_9CAEN